MIATQTENRWTIPVQTVHKSIWQAALVCKIGTEPYKSPTIVTWIFQVNSESNSRNFKTLLNSTGCTSLGIRIMHRILCFPWALSSIQFSLLGTIAQICCQQSMLDKTSESSWLEICSVTILHTQFKSGASIQINWRSLLLYPEIHKKRNIIMKPSSLI